MTRDAKGWTRDEMAARAAAELRDGLHVHLGVGLPTLAANHIPPGITITLLKDYGLVRLGAAAREEEGEPAFSAFFSAADNFDMIRGGRIDLAVLGAMQVAAGGDLANWMAPGKRVKG